MVYVFVSLECEWQKANDVNDQRQKTGPARRDLLRASSLLRLPVRMAADSQQRGADRSGAPDVVIENAAFRLVIGGDGIARSLVEKQSGQECLADSHTPAFSMTQYAPLAGQLILLWPADAKTLDAREVRREGDLLVVSFAGVPHQVAIRLKVTAGYMAFTVEQARTKGQGWRPSDLDKTPIEDLVFLQLPIRERKHFGQWLNVVWDDEVAVNLLAVNPWCRVDAQPRGGYRILRAGAEERVKTLGVSVALIAAPTSEMLDRVADVENDFNLPRGVESRRRKDHRYSYCWASRATPGNIDRHIAYARQGGFPC